MDKAKRQSNIELLRIITICGVIVLHYNNVTIGGGAGVCKRSEFIHPLLP